MAQTAKTMHHLHKKKPNNFNSTIEKLAYAVGIASPIVTLPQVLQIWMTQNASGVSLVTWVCYLVIVTVMTMYGIIHKEKPIIIMNGSLIFVDLLIIIGILMFG